MAEDTGSVEVSKDEFKNCPMCGKVVGSKTGPKITFSKPGTHAYARVACSCGLLSRTFDNLGDLRVWWNTRKGELPDTDKVTVNELRTPPEEF